MGDDPIDFRALDPTRDKIRFEAALRRLSASAESELVARMTVPTLFEVIVGWRPVALAAATVALVAGGYVFTRPPRSEPVLNRTVVAWSIGVPTELASWLDGGALPGPVELFPLETRVDP